MVYVTQQVYFIVKAVVDLSKDVTKLVKVEFIFLLAIVSHFKTFLNRSFQNATINFKTTVEADYGRSLAG